MERNELKQKAFGERREFKLTESGIETYVKDFEIESTNSWSFDNIEKNSRIYTTKNVKVLNVGLFAILFGIIRGLIFISSDFIHSLISGGAITFIGMCITAYYFFSQRKYFLIQMDDDKSIFILYNNPSKKEFDEFIETLYKKRAKYYRDSYFFIDYDDSKEKQLNKMNWLKKEEIISQSEYEVSTEEIRIKMI